MELNSSTIGLFVISIILLFSCVYLAVLLWVKRRNGKSLGEELSRLNLDIKKKKNQFERLKIAIHKASIKFKHLIDLENKESQLRSNVNSLEAHYIELKNNIEESEAIKSDLQSSIASIKEDISIFRPQLGLIDSGFYEEPDYLFETSDRFKEEIKLIRNQQKEIIKNKECILIPGTIALTQDAKYTKKILSDQSKLMITAFNIECDNLIGMVKSSNYANILERIDKVATNIEKSAVSLKCGFNKKYVNLKFKECELQYQFKLKQAREQEEQAIIKEQIREEQKAVREYERALAKAQKEEEMYKRALAQAHKELEFANDEQRAKLADKVRLLEQQLEEAENNQKRAQSLAEQTRRGHVYIISNIGSFGEDIYKIGLTRRLEPLDRVKELGDASVPFAFDVHAMIYSEDAPALESQLHREFNHMRVNQVNRRKEFFNVNLLEIKKAAQKIVTDDFDFRVTALAEEYYESLKMRGGINPIP